MSGGLLAGLFEASRIKEETGCTFAEALAEWTKSLPQPEPASNVIDFDRYRREPKEKA